MDSYLLGHVNMKKGMVFCTIVVVSYGKSRFSHNKAQFIVDIKALYQMYILFIDTDPPH